jgi:hypothetical protein
MNYSPRAQTLLIHSGLGSILVTGPKAEDGLLRKSSGTLYADLQKITRISCRFVNLPEKRPRTMGVAGGEDGTAHLWPLKDLVGVFQFCE